MRLKDIQDIFHKELDAIYGREEVDAFFYLLIESYFNVPRFHLALHPELSITKEEQTPIFNALHELKQEKPIQYIIGATEFYGLNFKVNPNVLIPRPETEELVDLILKNYKATEHLKILDVGTGSGCIAVALGKQINNAEVFAVDISGEAIKIAKENALANGVNVSFVNTDILDVNKRNSWFAGITFDIIVSNPPYVRELEKKEMKANVLNNEPETALFVDDSNPLVFYDAICEFAINKLNTNGQLYFEINQYLGPEMKALVDNYHFNDVRLKKDLAGNDRFVYGRFPN
ncbi:peptide chain release factor N(5)-glutamine methyltransferase [Winogradskyella sp. A3E31]|uniref:peptide chain release factor N(5)-glutamine methyltransferase n=1 Tax=Winogradskyella sp. A3E31 TaxID=3349637 RepID=UPI00398B9904